MYSRLNYKPSNKHIKDEDLEENLNYNSQNDFQIKSVVNDIEVKNEEIIYISEHYCKIIRDSFEVYKKNGLNNTLKVFIRMFSEHPEYKFIWPQFRQIPDSSFILSSALKQHAAVYFGGLKSIIENIDDKQKMDLIIKKIAYSHVKWEIKKSHIENMIPEILFVLKEILINYNKDVEDAWTALYTIIGDLLEEFKKGQKKTKL
ncbi:Globin family and Globin-like domain and Globin, structural domain-containing protein [Strongyloides ratti]|uniref:Globin family and Globin-like domain and Globin, structural domain-containing protein n=1 Tax=Strongyloides ratti TaxID=34506 RepID=A0A090LTA3_STRRB|nr:Globin family and Globin-like domain and Globin, structural domain-containing protein [Strongyloides ratti]CEF70839.1 Globin family and Globin-like domain and Globin, structural domain-containing protein [Strongyloides ratti]